jgi:NAD(P) transhydrogenase
MGIELAFGRRIERIAVNGGEAPVAVTLDDGRVVACDAALYCGGRAANIEGLGLDRLGIQTDARNRISVDDCFRTAVPSIFAAGDVIGFPALASTSMEQARVAVCHAFGFEYKRSVSHLVPYALYTIPEIAMVGATETSLQAAGRPYLVGRAHYRNNARAQILGDTGGLLRLLFAPDDLRLLGAQMIGERASEVIHVAQMCMQFDGTINAFIDSVFNFPTITDAYKYAAYDGLQARARWAETSR